MQNFKTSNCTTDYTLGWPILIRPMALPGSPTFLQSHPRRFAPFPTPPNIHSLPVQPFQIPLHRCHVSTAVSWYSKIVLNVPSVHLCNCDSHTSAFHPYSNFPPTASSYSHAYTYTHAPYPHHTRTHTHTSINTMPHADRGAAFDAAN